MVYSHSSNSQARAHTCMGSLAPRVICCSFSYSSVLLSAPMPSSACTAVSSSSSAWASLHSPATSSQLQQAGHTLLLLLLLSALLAARLSTPPLLLPPTQLVPLPRLPPLALPLPVVSVIAAWTAAAGVPATGVVAVVEAAVLAPGTCRGPSLSPACSRSLALAIDTAASAAGWAATSVTAAAWTSAPCGHLLHVHLYLALLWRGLMKTCRSLARLLVCWPPLLWLLLCCRLIRAVQLSGCATCCCISPTSRCQQNLSAGKDIRQSYRTMHMQWHVLGSYLDRSISISIPFDKAEGEEATLSPSSSPSSLARQCDATSAGPLTRSMDSCAVAIALSPGDTAGRAKTRLAHALPSPLHDSTAQHSKGAAAIMIST